MRYQDDGMPVGGIASAVAPRDIQCAIGSDGERGEYARILAEARPWCRVDEIVGYRGDGDVLHRESLATIMRDGQAFDRLLIYCILPDHVDGAVGSNLHRRALSPANRGIVMRGADGHRSAEACPSIRRSREEDLVFAEASDALFAELRPGSVDVIVEWALGVGIGCDGIFVIELRRCRAADPG